MPSPRQLSAYSTKAGSLLIWVTLLYCFATNQGHCMLIKFSVDGLNGLNAQAHNQRCSLNIVKWPCCEDDFILLCNAARQEMSLAVEPVTPCFFFLLERNPLLQRASAPLWRRNSEGTPSDKGTALLPFTPPILISGPDDSDLPLAERHVCPRLRTAEICLWCKHPCLSPWQPSLLPAVGCHASRLPHALPQPLALYCSWHVRRSPWICLVISVSLARRPPSWTYPLFSSCSENTLARRITPSTTGMFSLESAASQHGTARVNCWNNSVTSKKLQLQRLTDIAASGLNFQPLLFALPSTKSFIPEKRSSPRCVGLPRRLMQMRRLRGPFCTEFILGAKLLGGPDRGLSSKTCPPSQTKKHSLTQRHGANPAHFGDNN